MKTAGISWTETVEKIFVFSSSMFSTFVGLWLKNFLAEIEKTTCFQMQDMLVHELQKYAITMFPFKFIMII
jgi:hypothetical protein